MNWCFSTHSPRTVLSIMRPLPIFWATLQSPTKSSRNASLGGSSKQNGTEQYKQNHCRSRCNKHNKLDLLMVFHFHSAINAFRSRNQFFDLNQTGRKL